MSPLKEFISPLDTFQVAPRFLFRQPTTSGVSNRVHPEDLIYTHVTTRKSMIAPSDPSCIWKHRTIQVAMGASLEFVPQQLWKVCSSDHFFLHHVPYSCGPVLDIDRIASYESIEEQLDPPSSVKHLGSPYRHVSERTRSKDSFVAQPTSTTMP